MAKRTRTARSPAYEKLGLFYVGRPYDLATSAPRPGLTLYDARHLTTHAVCLGMTGSGKTGLCLGLIEEAAIDGIPVIAIDPKGDLGNLLLTFPALDAADFRPWIDEREAGRAAQTPDEFAAAEATRWREGLAAWHQDGARIARLRDASDFAIYTPGSTAGLPVSILESFAAPDPSLREDAELLVERVNTTATSLLTMAGVEAEPVRSREHVLVATVLQHAWSRGDSPDLTTLIQHVQQPPVDRVGVLDLESFYPAKDRFDLAMRINQLLAAPGFDLWLQGEPLDVDRLLYAADGRPRVSIMSIAHLGDVERMAFVSLLLNQVLGWMRAQPGTSSLRALLYMDEVFGYLPPVAEPPSKAPLLTLMKQARAHGLGVVLATQNPVDLDYKSLSNAGTWFLGRLQTERDKARVLDGLEGVAAGSRGAFDRRSMEQTLAGLQSRVFLMHNVHEDAPDVFETRWVMSYLRGPLTRGHIQALMSDREETRSGEESRSGGSSGLRARRRATSKSAAALTRPILPPGVQEYFVPGDPAAGNGVYRPVLYAAASLDFIDRRLDVSETRDVAFVFPIGSGASPVRWDEGEPAPVAPDELRTSPEGDEATPAGMAFGELPPAALKPKSYERWTREFKRWLVRTQRLELLRCKDLKMVSRPGESERDFRIRLRDRAHERRDETTAKLRATFGSKIRTLSDRVRRAELAVARESEQASQQKLQTALSFGAAALSAILGRTVASRSTLGRATTAARGVGRSRKEKEDVARATENLHALQAQLESLEAELEAAIDDAEATLDPLTVELTPVSLKPRSRGMAAEPAVLAWTSG